MSVVMDAPPAAPAAPSAPAAPASSPNPNQSPGLLQPSQTPPAPVKPGSAAERLRQALWEKANKGQPQTPEPPKKETPKQEPTTPEAGEDEDEIESTISPPDDKKAADPKPGDPPADQKKQKTNPWKVVDQWKTRAGELERQLAEAKKASIAEQEKAEYLSKIETHQKRVEELEKEMYFVNYEKSADFKTKYQEPYERAWKLAMEDLQGLTLEDPETGVQRPFTSNDMSAILNIDDLRQARQMANQLYGELADDVMAHRKEIRKIFQQRTEALREAREKGSARDKERQEFEAKHMKELTDSIGQHWTKANEEMTKHEKYGTYFVPKEGDEQGNARLTKGFMLVDRAMSENPMNPKLTAEERRSIIERQAAIRNRAAAFGRVRAWYEAARAELEQVKAELAQYKGSEPTVKGSDPGSGMKPAVSARQSLYDSLHKMAK